MVDEYKHVGTTKNALASLGQEIKIRANGIWNKTKPLRKRLFRDNDIQRDVKCSALRVMFLSSQLFQAGAWPELHIGEYKSCKAALIRTYKLACFDAYGNGGYTEAGDFDKLSDGEVILRAEQVHPAVLLRVLRLLSSIRMACKASWETWCLLFAAHGSKRSWTKALLADIKWLVEATVTFADLDCSTLGPWLVMARDFPKQTARAVMKICLEPKAVQCAEALALGKVVDDIVTDAVADDSYHCRFCAYHGSARQVQCHEQRLHAAVSDLMYCADSCTCSICGLTFESVVVNRRHSRESLLCKLNLLRHGPVIEGLDLLLSLDEDASFKSANGKAGKTTMKTSGCCVRAFGPHRIIYDADGHIVQASKRGHPLGNGRPLFLPPHLLEHVEVLELPCPAARYSACTDWCGLCGGSYG